MSYCNSTALVTLGLALLMPAAAFAQITNTATVSATYGSTSVEAEDFESVDVVEAAPNLTITKTVKATDLTNGQSNRWDAEDTITFQYVIKNEGNVTLKDVTPVDSGPTFGGEDPENTLGDFVVAGSSPVENTAELAPGESATFEAVYTLANLDVYHAADTKDLVGAAKNLVSNTATSEGVKPDDTEYEDMDESTVTLALDPKAEIGLVKTAVLNDEVNDDDKAQVGETITYTYTVTNTGNVPLEGISIADIHEDVALASGLVVSETLTTEGPLEDTIGATSTNDTANDGTWDPLQPEAVVTFTYVHTVTQAEVDGG